MKLTEDAARMKICPTMSYRGEHGALSRPVLCVASDCMLWRWRDNHQPEFLEQRYRDPESRPKPQGYCGLSN